MKLPLGLLATVLVSAAYATPLSECLGYAPADKVLIVNADDLGMHPELDRAAFRLIDKKLIQDISVMPPTPGFAKVAEMAKARGMAVGVHLTLTNEWQEKQPWGAVLPKSEVPSLYNDQGNLWASVDELVKHAKPEEVKREILAQIAKVQAAGLTVTHLDGHMLFWRGSKAFIDIYAGLARETGIPTISQFAGMSFEQQLALNQGIQKDLGVVTPDTFTMLYNPALRRAGMRFPGYDNVLASLPAGVNHLIIHPAEDSPGAREAIADLQLRLSDFDVWNGPEVHKVIQQKKLKLTNYLPLKALQQQVDASPKNCLQGGAR
ncbi:polysaccharide deacetylase family protein [Andreprevotia sp. IGB-42]|uniref:polysaccharide deacetylase family protein n=1 Tax=Andreprevotia sp. IGB-42 TaxID=2497473 RepID=UPI001F22FE1D|nr:polysaccharide deacetylase family protein [Andreprevotia sp. IGB-42]